MRSLFQRRPETTPATNWRLGLSDIMFAGLMALLTINSFLPARYGILEAEKPYFFDSLNVIQVPAGNILSVEVVEGGVLMEGSFVGEKALRRDLISWCYNGQFFDTATTKYVSLRTDRDALYTDYLMAKDAILAGGNRVLDEMSLRQYGRPCGTDLPFKSRAALRSALRVRSVEERLIDHKGVKEYRTF